MARKTKEIGGQTWHLKRGFRLKSDALKLAKKTRTLEYAPSKARVVKSGHGWAVYIR